VLAPAPLNISPSQRFRYEHYIGKTERDDISFLQKPFFTIETWRVLHKQKNYFKKITGIILGFLKRFLLLFNVYKFDYVFIHREAAPIGPPVFEWMIAKILRKKIIYDFDDAIWIRAASEANPMIADIKCTWKVGKICSYSHIVSVGNEFLAKYARNYNHDVRIIPTVVNTEEKHASIKNQDDKPLTIGWTGTFTNLIHLEKIVPVIKKLKEKYEFTFLIIGNKNPDFKDIDYQYIEWNIHSEIDDLIKMNIGIMPLNNTESEMGKCAFKAIQYMSLGIPAVVSPVGANCNVVSNKINGFWADSDDQWYQKLEILITNNELRKEMGILARNSIVNNFSVSSQKSNFFQLFE
jgi:glycosyltransferase involved in cell wall biosynthesis